MNLHDALKATKRAFRGSLHLYQEREMRFSLGRNIGGSRQQGIAAFEKTQREYAQEQRKRKPYKKEKEDIAAKMEQLREKEDNQERVAHGEENKNERAKCCHI